MKSRNIIYKISVVSFLFLSLWSCKAPQASIEAKQKTILPTTYNGSQDTLNTGSTSWRQFFNDPHLVSLIEVALQNNQELMITLQEIEIAKNDVLYKKGLLKPSVSANIGAGVEKSGRYTGQGAGDAVTEILPGKLIPDPLTDLSGRLTAEWEVDVWKKLRNSKKAAIKRYLSTVEGKNFVLSNLIAEIANSYYELLALDNHLDITKQNIELQKAALEVVRVQKQAARGTELAVKKFEAELFKSQGLEYSLRQQVTEEENRINALLGRLPQPIEREKSSFLTLIPTSIKVGIPSQLLLNRPDIKQAELELEAAKLDVKVARSKFYPSLNISASYGLNAFKPSYLMTTPESVVYSIVGDIVAPLINRSAIKAEFNTANAHQLQVLYEYDKRILNAYIDVANQMSKIKNIQKVFDYKFKEKEMLVQSVDIANELFKSSKADYLEVLLTQRDAMDAKMELIDVKEQQLNTVVDIYKSLGGGWK